MRRHVVIPVAAKSRYTAMMDDPNLLKHRLVCRNSKDWLIVSCNRPKSIQRTCWINQHSIFPLEGEMRRTFNVIIISELLLSFQAAQFYTRKNATLSL